MTLEAVHANSTIRSRAGAMVLTVQLSVRIKMWTHRVGVAKFAAMLGKLAYLGTFLTLCGVAACGSSGDTAGSNGGSAGQGGMAGTTTTGGGAGTSAGNGGTGGAVVEGELVGTTSAKCPASILPDAEYLFYSCEDPPDEYSGGQQRKWSLYRKPLGEGAMAEALATSDTPIHLSFQDRNHHYFYKAGQYDD
ncbi:MAG: hypothetical protein KC766_12000, partial [Myxococcales bacterium]|nr:hypothetical protein [Myxococcales bacterium]